MKLKAVVDILQSKLHKRGVPLKALTYGTVRGRPRAGASARRSRCSRASRSTRRKEIVRLIKDSKVKVQASINEDKVRVAGKNRDDLQKIIALVKEKDLGIAVSFDNYRST